MRKAEREAAKAAPEAKTKDSTKREAAEEEYEDKENVDPNALAVVAETEKKPRCVCSVLQRRQGAVWTGRVHVSLSRIVLPSGNTR